MNKTHTSPKIVAVTGGIGTGKSTIAKLFAELGAKTIDADEIARELVEPGAPLLKEIVNSFGKGLLNPDKTLNRAKLRQIIFTNPRDKKWLEDLLHPAIYRTMAERAQTADASYCLLVIPLLFESKPPFHVNRVLVVDTPIPTRKQRLHHRAPDLSIDEIENIMKHQIDRSELIKLADDVIHNDGDFHTLKQQVVALHAKYLTL